MSRTLKLEICFNCNTGIFTKIPEKDLHSYDYNPWTNRPEKPCNKCGTCRDTQKIIQERNILNKLSNRYIKKLLYTFCNNQLNFDGKTFDEILDKLKNQCFRSIYELAEELNNIFQENQISINQDFILNTLYNTISIDSFAY